MTDLNPHWAECPMSIVKKIIFDKICSTQTETQKARQHCL